MFSKEDCLHVWQISHKESSIQSRMLGMRVKLEIPAEITQQI